jgi:hypothetical protein
LGEVGTFAELPWVPACGGRAPEAGGVDGGELAWAPAFASPPVVAVPPALPPVEIDGGWLTVGGGLTVPELGLVVTALSERLDAGGAGG